ncbi:MAG: hypothetical protein Q8K36_06260, partial [Alphaproteobacteria bacterium]|nr:hypothetical protein [Alphaproteobacteria bacterium]
FLWVEKIAQILASIVTVNPMIVHIIGISQDKSVTNENDLCPDDALQSGEVALNYEFKERFYPDSLESEYMSIESDTLSESSETESLFSEDGCNHHVYLSNYFFPELRNFEACLQAEFPEGMDLIFSEHTLHRVTNPLQKLVGAYNILRPGGLLLWQQFNIQIVRDRLGDRNQPQTIIRNRSRGQRDIDCFLDMMHVDYLTHYSIVNHSPLYYSIVRRGQEPINCTPELMDCFQSSKTYLYNLEGTPPDLKSETISYLVFTGLPEHIAQYFQGNKTHYQIVQEYRSTFFCSGNRGALEFYINMHQISLKERIWRIQKVSSQFHAMLHHKMVSAVIAYLSLKLKDVAFLDWYAQKT